MGRPEIGPPIHLRLPADLLAEIDQQAANADDGAGISRAEMVRRLLAEAVRPTSGRSRRPTSGGTPVGTFHDEMYPAPAGRHCDTHPDRPAVGKTITHHLTTTAGERRYACGECWDGAEPWTSRRLGVMTSGGAS